MPYEIELSEDAISKLSQLSDIQLVKVHEELLNLGRSPTYLSRPSVCPPDPPGWQKYEFWIDEETFIRAFFYYLADEATLKVELIGIVEYGN